jgi:hypothetical protein
VSCFIKNETTIKATDPRNISPRKDEFLVTLGPYISAIEHAAVDCEYLVKGLDITKRDVRMDYLNDFGKYIETDYSRYDAHISPEVMQYVEGTIFRTCFPKEDHPEFHAALKQCESTVGFTLLGWKYTATGRCSGDAHTSLGNGLINRFNTWLVFRDLPYDSWRSTHEGDDGIMGCTHDVYPQAIANTMLFGILGFPIKLETPIMLQLSSFCGRTLFASPFLQSMCQVRRTLSKFHITCCQLPGRRAVLAKALSYWSTDSTTPIVGILCYVIIMLLKPNFRDRRAFARTQSFSNYAKSQLLIAYDNLNLVIPVINSEARVALSLKETISIDLQVSIENILLNWLVLGYIPSQFPLISDVDPHVDDQRTTYYGHSYPCFSGATN